MKILITGIAGFIGFHLAKQLAMRGDEIVGLDNINGYYDVKLKYGRLNELGLSIQEEAGNIEEYKKIYSSIYPNLCFTFADIVDVDNLKSIFLSNHFDCVIHLAAQAGVRYSLINPDLYISSNIQGFLNILETIRTYPVKHFIYASSSSVYGLNTIQPFSEKGAADHQTSLYAVSKRCNELMAHSYSHLYGIPSTGLRFFTVYGPWGRPDMAPFLFTKAILEKKPIDVFNYGDMRRDFTYIDDIIEGIMSVITHIPVGSHDWDGIQSDSGPAPARIYNIGNGKPIQLLHFIQALESELGIKAEKNMLPSQPGDVSVTWADCSALERDTGYHPHTEIQDGIKHFVEWYRLFYKISV
ncbi:MAG: NAD-dependent epimerase [Bacteroidales bacterium]|jgi:UDP-glucuronate 4-epimerase|nr:NAD-dependent epimerase [Bacteroidales bacterium]